MSDIDRAAAARLTDVQARIAHAASLARRKPEDVELIAISKTKSADEIAPLIAAGQASFGENRVQEAEGKWRGLFTSPPLPFRGEAGGGGSPPAPRGKEDSPHPSPEGEGRRRDEHA